MDSCFSSNNLKILNLFLLIFAVHTTYAQFSITGFSYQSLGQDTAIQMHEGIFEPIETVDGKNYTFGLSYGRFFVALPSKNIVDSIAKPIQIAKRDSIVQILGYKVLKYVANPDTNRAKYFNFYLCEGSYGLVLDSAGSLFGETDGKYIYKSNLKVPPARNIMIGTIIGNPKVWFNYDSLCVEYEKTTR